MRVFVGLSFGGFSRDVPAAPNPLLPAAEALAHVCDVRGDEDLRAFRLNDEKVLTYLKAKVGRPLGQAAWPPDALPSASSRRAPDPIPLRQPRPLHPPPDWKNSRGAQRAQAGDGRQGPQQQLRGRRLHRDHRRHRVAARQGPAPALRLRCGNRGHRQTHAIHSHSPPGPMRPISHADPLSASLSPPPGILTEHLSKDLAAQLASALR